MTQRPTLLLRPGHANRIVAGHPWIFGSDVLRLTQAAEDGEVIHIKDHRQRWIGTGFYNSKSKIVARVISREREEFNEEFFEKRISEALEVRHRHMPEATSFRVVNSEGDFLSGLVVDKYEDVLVIQTTALGMDLRRGEIVNVLKKLFKPRAILERNDNHFRKFEGLEMKQGLITGQLESPKVPIKLNGLEFTVDLDLGHKTGMYLDQQANYQGVADLIRKPGAQVLDCFTFQGGFALHAARAGANVNALDQSEDAVATATANAKANGLTKNCQFEQANVFDWLKDKTIVAPHERVTPEYDMVVLDPPSFTRNKESVPNALRGYKDIHLRAMKLLKTGGTLATFCCSHHVDSNTFLDVIMAAAYDAKVLLRRIAIYSQSPDHPIIPEIAETEYLKGFAFEIVR